MIRTDYPVAATRNQVPTYPEVCESNESFVSGSTYSTSTAASVGSDLRIRPVYGWTPDDYLNLEDFQERYDAAPTNAEKAQICGEAQTRFYDILYYYYMNPRGEQAHKMLKNTERLRFLRRHAKGADRDFVMGPDRFNDLINPLWKMQECEIAVYTIDLDIYEDDIRPIETETSDNPASFVQYAIPEGTFYYPEPYIASPSYIYNDIAFLHILHYWYWLWFIFIFLICFYFITFLCVVRWHSNRVKPRRETRGVSRSKCADMITAMVPTGWAISIIVHETTDATDLNDGFGTGEIVVGVRAYQWGWEYYYPKSIDLNYNVRPSYATFVGNSVKYNSSSSASLDTNYLWRMYQNTPEDSSVLPAHLLVAPLDSTNSFNFVNFKAVGLNTLRESTAFAKIRNSSKSFTSHLVHAPSELTSKYNNIISAYVDESTLWDANSLNVKRPHNLASVSALGNTPAALTMDTASFNKLLEANYKANTASQSVSSSVYESPNSFLLASHNASGLNSTSSLNFLEGAGSSKLTSGSQFASAISNERYAGLNANSDKAGLSHPLLKLTSIASNAVTRSPGLASLSLGSHVTGSGLGSELAARDVSASKYFNLNGPNSGILAGDQTVRNFTPVGASSLNLNFAHTTNSISSNMAIAKAFNFGANPLSSVKSTASDNIDASSAHKLLSSQTFVDQSHPPIMGARSSSQGLGFDSAATDYSRTGLNANGAIETGTVKGNIKVPDAYVGSRERSPKFLNSAYWSTFWANSNPNMRIGAILRANGERPLFYLPAFTDYADYDFRNDQAVDLLEDAFWETSYSSYNFYEYLASSADAASAQTIPADELSATSQYLKEDLLEEQAHPALTQPLLKDLSALGDFYSSVLQLEDYVSSPSLLKTSGFGFYAILSDLVNVDDSFAAARAITNLSSKYSAPSVAISSDSLTGRSYASVLNNFRSDLEDHNWLDIKSLSTGCSLGDHFSGSTVGSDTLLSNPAVLRSSARNSIVNFNAFQKVFRPRFDEGRANVTSINFADLGLKQPFLSDTKVPYLQMLGKNRDSFYTSPSYNLSTVKNLNVYSSLTELLNSPTYDFPFLLGRTSDEVRFLWIDWFAKWKHLEVQPSSVSKYSTLGVPYLRRPFDYNSDSGDKFQDTELYFTRTARSRRNFVTNWSYSPFMYSRSYVWDRVSDIAAPLYVDSSSVSVAFECSNSLSAYWTRKAFSWEGVSSLTYSSSGNDIYSKSTWRPKDSIAAYYYNTARLVDVLSKREYIYRRLLEANRGTSVLPKSLTATPSNPLLLEVKSSFRFIDPAVFSSEYSRDTLFSSSTYLKYSIFKSLVQSAGNTAAGTPVNMSLLNDFTFFYFFSTDTSKVGQNLELYKNQFRPLKKGISSMLRLHATGAVAMPVELRIQVLASSRDVIHSWSIPAASIKIDCVPGYTSHRIMKFLLTGIYWGQCQEICGRYHHWMPIVVYFMKRDLFFLWCTHFIFAPKPHEDWEIADRKFADFIKFVSYDKSSWLVDIDKHVL